MPLLIDLLDDLIGHDNLIRPVLLITLLGDFAGDVDADALVCNLDVPFGIEIVEQFPEHLGCVFQIHMRFQHQKHGNGLKYLVVQKVSDEFGSLSRSGLIESDQDNRSSLRHTNHVAVIYF